LSKPALASAGLVLFSFQWQAYLWPLLIAPAPNYTLAPIALADFQGAFTTDFAAIFAGSALLTVIPAVVIISLQRFFTESVATVGIKG
jgi:ABC-type glycerol-3-phosphate transport system permease component